MKHEYFTFQQIVKNGKCIHNNKKQRIWNKVRGKMALKSAQLNVKWDFFNNYKRMRGRQLFHVKHG